MTELSAAASILFTVRDHGPISRAEISRLTQFSQSVVSTITRVLIERGIIREVGTRREELGRPSIMLEICARHSFFAGFSVAGEEARGILTDLAGTVVGERSAVISDSDPEGVVSLLTSILDELLETGGISREELRGAGLALSGLIDGSEGDCIQSTVLGWRDVPIRSLLRRRFELPFEVENDANAVALGERLYGAAQHHRNFAVISIGHGIGAGVFVSGELHRGAHGVSGELGHCTVELNGPPCRCGKRGCLEAVAGVPVLLAEARSRGLEVDALAEIETLAAHGNEIAREILARAGAALGLALSHLVNLFSPELVIVTGSGTKLGPILEAAVRERYIEHVLPMLPDRPRLLFRHEDGAVWARGAAGLAARAFLRAGGEVVSTM